MGLRRSAVAVISCVLAGSVLVACSGGGGVSPSSSARPRLSAALPDAGTPAGAQLIIVAGDGGGLAEIARHLLSVPGSPRICDEHYPGYPGGNGPRQPRPRARTRAEETFLERG